MLKPCDDALWNRYDVALLDLDGVVYIGPDAVPGAPDHLGRAAAEGMRLAYVTNNAARPPGVVAEHLRELGIPAKDEEVVTSAQAAARLLSERCPAGSAVFVIGGDGLFEALAELGLRPVQQIADDPVAVVSGYHRDLRWGTVSDGAILVRGGLPWVATNTDMSVPTQHGHGPGNGVLVDAVARFAGRTPVVAGKPQPPLFEETLRRVGGSRPLVVGDRLDTDIEGAVRTGYDSLLVMTGVTRLHELVSAPPERRPTYVAMDLESLGRRHPVPEQDGATWAGTTYAADVEDGRLVVHTRADRDPEEGPEDGTAADDWWRVVACAAWQHLDTTGAAVDVEELSPPSSVAP